MGVTMGPGCTELARIPSAAYCMAVALVSRRTAPLEAWYCGLLLSTPTRPSWDEMLMMDPPPARRIAGMAVLLPRKTPVALISMTRCHSSTGVSSTLPWPLTPALLTRMCNAPKWSSAVATACCQSASRVTSRRTNTASPPAARMSASTFRPSASRMSPMTTFAPSWANRHASTAPIPRAAPLINATLPANRIATLHSQGLCSGSQSYGYCRRSLGTAQAPDGDYCNNVHLWHNRAVIMARFSQYASSSLIMEVMFAAPSPVPQTLQESALIPLKHILSAENTLKTLQAFSGNLTLLSASVATDERATQELHFMNQGLQEVLQEFNDAHR